MLPAGGAEGFRLAQHDEHARELNELERTVLHERAAHHGNPELLVGVHILDRKMNVPHPDADLVGFDELGHARA